MRDSVINLGFKVHSINRLLVCNHAPEVCDWSTLTWNYLSRKETAQNLTRLLPSIFDLALACHPSATPLSYLL